MTCTTSDGRTSSLADCASACRSASSAGTTADGGRSANCCPDGPVHVATDSVRTTRCADVASAAVVVADDAAIVVVVVVAVGTAAAAAVVDTAAVAVADDVVAVAVAGYADAFDAVAIAAVSNDSQWLAARTPCCRDR